MMSGFVAPAVLAKCLIDMAFLGCYGELKLNYQFREDCCFSCDLDHSLILVAPAEKCVKSHQHPQV